MIINNHMPRQKAIVTLVVLTAAWFIWYAVSAYPLGRQEEDVVGLQGAPAEIITLNPGQTVSQTFRPTPHHISAVSVYSTDERLDGRKVTAQITGSSGRVLASSSTVRPSYRAGKLKLTLPLKWQEVDTPQDLRLRMRLNSDPPLKLYALTENVYPYGQLRLGGQPQNNLDLSLTAIQPSPTPLAVKQGAGSGLFVLLGALIVYLIPARLARQRWLAAGALLTAAVPLALGGFWNDRQLLGINDWDFYFSVHHDVRTILLDHGVFPFWNPYICGGTAGLADPEFRLFTFTFLLEVIFGIPIGLRLSIFFATAVGGLGMLALSKRIGLSPLAGLLAALAVSFSSVNLLEIVEGHPNIFSAMWIPWIFWAWLAAYRQQRVKFKNTNNKQSANSKTQILRPAVRNLKFVPWRLPAISAWTARGFKRLTTQLKKANRWALLCGIFLALTFFQGGIYLLMYTAMAFTVLPLLASRPRQAMAVTFKAGLWALGLAAIKLVPVLFWLSQFQDQAYASSAATLPYLHEIFLGRHLHGAEVLPGQGTGWHEYGAYVGPLVIALALLGLTRVRQSRLARALAISTVSAVLLSSAGPVLKPAFDLLPFLPRSSISRFVLFAVIPVSLLAGFGLDFITARRRGKARPVNTSYLIRSAIPGTLAVTLVGLTAIDLMSLSYPLSSQAFKVPTEDVKVLPAPQPITYTTNTYQKRIDGVDYTRSYLAARAGYGTLNYCTPLSPPISVVAAEDQEKDSGAVTVSGPGGGQAILKDWSPNEIKLRAEIHQPADVIVNTNYAKGWQVTTTPAIKGQARTQPARDISGRVGVRLTPGTYLLTFRYHAPGFIPGLLLTVLTLAVAGITTARRSRDKTATIG